MCERLGHQPIGVGELPDPDAEQHRGHPDRAGRAIGTACTEAKPSSVAAAASVATAPPSDCMSATEIGCPVA